MYNSQVPRPKPQNTYTFTTVTMNCASSTTKYPPTSPVVPSQRLRVAFNRETNFILSPEYQQQQQQHQQNIRQLGPPTTQQQQHPVPHIDNHNNIRQEPILQSLHTPEIHMSEPINNNTSAFTSNASPVESPALEPTAILHDLEYMKPSVYRENSGFDGEAAQARFFARQISSRRLDSPVRRRRMPMKREKEGLGERRGSEEEYGSLGSSAFGAGEVVEDDYDNGNDAAAADDRRGRRRRRIGSEIGQDMMVDG